MASDLLLSDKAISTGRSSSIENFDRTAYRAYYGRRPPPASPAERRVIPPLSHKTVLRIVHKQRQTGLVADKPWSGRLKSTTPRQHHILSGRAWGTVGLPHQNCELRWKQNMGCSWRLELFASDSLRRVCGGTKKPLVRDATVRKRLAFTHEYRDWIAAQWDNVLWSDESFGLTLDFDSFYYFAFCFEC